MTQPTTEAQKYDAAMLADQAETQRRRQQELTPHENWLYGQNPDGRERRNRERILREEADSIHAERVESDLARQKELLQAAVNMADDNRAAFELQRAHAADLSNRLVEIRNIATVALYDHERMTVTVLADALGEILKIARGGK